MFKKYIQIVITSIKRTMTYPAAVVMDNLSMALDIMVYLYIWKAVFNEQPIIANITYEQMISYIIIARMLNSLIVWGVNMEISKVIRNGDITVELIRPIRIWSAKIFF